MSSELKHAVTSLGFPKAANKYIFCQEEDEDQLSRTMTIMIGVVYLLQTHFVSFYERAALIDEFKTITHLFEQAQKNMMPDGGEQCEAICAAMNEMVSSVKKRAEKSMREELGGKEGFNMVDEQVMLMKPAVIAKAIAISTVYVLNDDELIEAKRTGEPPKALVRVVVKSLKQAYMSRPTDNVVAVFNMHARTELNRAIEKMFKKRELSL